MIFAELAGKLGSEYQNAHERAEDIFTSTAFGTLRYIPPDLGLVPFLNRVRLVAFNEMGVSLEPSMPLIADLLQAEYTFWPNLSSYGQPDVIIELLTKFERIVVLIEAKLHSTKSSTAHPENVPDPERPDADQLVKYWHGVGRSHFVTNSDRIYLIYLTSHASAPVYELGESMTREPTMKLGWLSWRDLWLVLRKVVEHDPNQVAARDLVTLLEHKSLTYFRGFSVGVQIDSPVEASFWKPGERRWFRYDWSELHDALLQGGLKTFWSPYETR